MLNVYQRCLTNYQELMWDQGAFVMFNATLQKQLRLDHVMPAIPDPFGVSTCLLAQKATGGDNAACLQDYFLKGTQAVDYFQYSNITGAAGSNQIDACLAFSGPSSSPNPYIASVFLACLEHNANRSGCDIPHMLWSGRSTNKVPVATQHTLNISDMDKKLQLAQGEIAAVQQHVLSVLDALEAKWSQSNAGEELHITLFTSEGIRSSAPGLSDHLTCVTPGDLLHQYADCVMQVMTHTPRRIHISPRTRDTP